MEDISDALVLTDEEMAAPPPEPVPSIERPCWQVLDNKTELIDEGKVKSFGPGVWFFSFKQTKEGRVLIDTWVCSPLHVIAITHDSGDDFGRLLRFKPTRGKWREWSMPMEMLKGSCDDLRGHLLSCGVEINYRARAMLAEYVQVQHPRREVVAVGRTGWHGRDTFVLPHRKIGKADVIFQSPNIEVNHYASAGTLDGWRTNVGSRCSGNTVLMFACSAGLAGTLQNLMNKGTGAGVHTYGPSSHGKTAALWAAASLWGSKEFAISWRATANGLEGWAERRNDTCLMLDEMKQAAAREIDQVVYMVGCGTGKARASKDGGARKTKRWLLFLLSNGEQPLHVFMELGGLRVHAGQDVRLPSVLVTDRKHGAFDCIHDEPTAKGFADKLMAATQRDYGHVGPAFVEKLIESGDIEKLSAMEAKFLERFTHESEQEGRVASTFVLAAMAGELAISYGLFPWEEDSALNAAIDLFNRWRAGRSKGNFETARLLDAVSDFIATHGDSRFSDINPPKFNDEPLTAKVNNRAGWWRDRDGQRIYMFTSAGLKDATKGFELSQALNVLDAAGWIAERDAAQIAKAVRANGSLVRLYHIAPKTLEACKN